MDIQLSALSCFMVTLLTMTTFQIQISSAIKNNAYLLENHSSYSLVISVTSQNGMKSPTNGSQIFTVQAPKYHRVMIVIQQLHLWPEVDKDSQSYLQYVDSDGSLSKRVYGNIDPEETDLVPQYLTGPRSFESREDTASLVFINLHPDHSRSKNERRVYAKAVFTAFRDTCSYRSIPAPENRTASSTPPTPPQSKEMIYRSCTTSSASGKNCIAAQLFCDGNINCANGDQSGNIGADEMYSNCNSARDTSNGRRAKSLDSERVKFSTVADDEVRMVRHKTETQATDGDNKSIDLLKKYIVDQEYDEYFTDMFKCLIIGFLGLCTTGILIAFVVAMFCLKNNRHES